MKQFIKLQKQEAISGETYMNINKIKKVIRGEESEIIDENGDNTYDENGKLVYGIMYWVLAEGFSEFIRITEEQFNQLVNLEK